MEDKDMFRVGKYTVDLDLTEVLNGILDLHGKRNEKYLLHWLLLKLSGHEVELARILSGAFPDLGKQMTSFFQKRVVDHRNSLRVAKVLSFRSARSIEEEAVRKAWEEMTAMVGEVSALRDETMRGLVNDHREMLRRLCAALVELVMERKDMRIGFDFDALGKFLKGGPG